MGQAASADAAPRRVEEPLLGRARRPWWLARGVLRDAQHLQPLALTPGPEWQLRGAMRRLEQVRVGDGLQVALVRLVGDAVPGARLVGELHRQVLPVEPGRRVLPGHAPLPVHAPVPEAHVAEAIDLASEAGRVEDAVQGRR